VGEFRNLQKENLILQIMKYFWNLSSTCFAYTVKQFFSILYVKFEYHNALMQVSLRVYYTFYVNDIYDTEWTISFEFVLKMIMLTLQCLIDNFSDMTCPVISYNSI
jgi:hypothetical protein